MNHNACVFQVKTRAPSTTVVVRSCAWPRWAAGGGVRAGTGGRPRSAGAAGAMPRGSRSVTRGASTADTGKDHPIPLLSNDIISVIYCMCVFLSV